MDRLAELLRARSIPLRLVIYPWPTQIERGERDNPHVAYWHEWSRRTGTPLLDLFPAFIGGEPGRQTLERLFIASDVHWNAAGHALVADELRRFLKRAK